MYKVIDIHNRACWYSGPHYYIACNVARTLRQFNIACLVLIPTGATQ